MIIELIMGIFTPRTGDKPAKNGKLVSHVGDDTKENWDKASKKADELNKKDFNERTRKRA